MLNKLLFAVTQKLALLFVAGLVTVGGVLTMGSANNSASQTAIIVNTTVTVVALPAIPPDLLPSTTIPFCTATSTCGEQGLQKLVRSLGMVFKKIATPKPIAAV